MKELSTKEKAKRYDEVIVMAKKCITHIPDEAVNKYMLDMFPELKESKAEKPNGGIVSEDFNEGAGFYKVNLAYLSKEQVEEIESLVKKWNPESEDERIRKQIISFLKEFEHDHYRSLDFSSWIAWLEKQCEQKPVDKVGPKFKVGDWVAINPELRFASPLCIKNIDDNNYRVKSLDGNSGAPTIDYLDNHYHLWTIEDAKEGDVLAGKIDGDSYILIYKQIKDGWIETYGHYYDSVDRFCVPTQLFCREVNGTFYPATKEQRDLLFTKIKDAGYASTVKIDALIDELKLL